MQSNTGGRELRLEKLRTLLVELVLSLRRQYLAAGGNAITHWERLENAIVAAARQSGTIDRWTTKIRNKLNLSGLSGDDARILLDLCSQVKELGADRECLGLAREETALLIAMARKCAEERREKSNG